MIVGYPGAPSVFPDAPLLFHVSTDAPEFRVEIYRQDATLVREACSSWLPGTRFPLLAPYDDWSEVWAGHALRVCPTLQPGVHVAMFVEGDGSGHELATQRLDRTTADGREAKALFVVKNPFPGRDARIVYKLPLFTYAAYNMAGDPAGCLYTWPGRKVTLHRPGNGTGGTPRDAFIPDVYDPASPRQTFEHWDAKLVRWLAARGLAVDYVTDLDVHQNDGDFLSAYRLLLSVGHDEYWSAPMRAHVESFVARGGNVAFFSGNTCYWHVTVEGPAISVDKRVHPGHVVPFDLWHRTRPENALTGVSYHNAGGQWNGPRPSNGGYTVRRARHWVFAGTGVEDGDVIGEGEALVGYECDGAAFTSGPGGVPVTTGEDCSPIDLDILATAPVPDWEGAEAGRLSTATMGVHARRGIVFTAGTVDWPRVLGQGDPIVDRITRNVLDRLATHPVRVAGPFPTRAGRAVAVEGERGTFYVDTRGLADDVSFCWSVSAGAPGPLDGPSLSLAMPSPPVLVTISVVVSAAGEPVAFGTLTVQPFTRAELTWFEMTAELDALTRRGRAPEEATMLPGEGAPCAPASLHPLLDPAEPFVQRPPSPPEARDVSAIQAGAERLADLARRLLEQGGGLR
jgi:hypothetical protein